MRKRLTAVQVLDALEKLHSPPRSFLEWRTPLDLLIATVLSAQCTDAVVNRVTRDLFAHVRTPRQYLALSRAQLERKIRPCGTYRNKAKFIHGICEILLRDFDGSVPETMCELLTLPGVGRKTASIVLWAAFGVSDGIAVDTHVARLAVRLGLSQGKTPGAIELDLLKQVPESRRGSVNGLLISHGRAICTARNPKCENCVFRHSCPSSRLS